MPGSSTQTNQKAETIDWSRDPHTRPDLAGFISKRLHEILRTYSPTTTCGIMGSIDPFRACRPSLLKIIADVDKVMAGKKDSVDDSTIDQVNEFKRTLAAIGEDWFNRTCYQGVHEVQQRVLHSMKYNIPWLNRIEVQIHGPILNTSIHPSKKDPQITKTEQTKLGKICEDTKRQIAEMKQRISQQKKAGEETEYPYVRVRIVRGLENCDPSELRGSDRQLWGALSSAGLKPSLCENAELLADLYPKGVGCLADPSDRAYDIIVPCNPAESH